MHTAVAQARLSDSGQRLLLRETSPSMRNKPACAPLTKGVTKPRLFEAVALVVQIAPRASRRDRRSVADDIPQNWKMH